MYILGRGRKREVVYNPKRLGGWEHCKFATAPHGSCRLLLRSSPLPITSTRRRRTAKKQRVILMDNSKANGFKPCPCSQNLQTQAATATWGELVGLVVLEVQLNLRKVVVTVRTRSVGDLPVPLLQLSLPLPTLSTTPTLRFCIASST